MVFPGMAMALRRCTTMNKEDCHGRPDNAPSWRLQFRRRHGGVSEICGEVCGPVARAGTSGTGAGATVRWDGFAGSDAGRRRLPHLFRQSSDQHRTFAGKADDGQSVPDGYGYRSRMWFLEHSERIGYEIVFSRQRGRAENRIFPVHQILWSRLFGAIRWRFSCCFSGERYRSGFEVFRRLGGDRTLAAETGKRHGRLSAGSDRYAVSGHHLKRQ